MRNIGHRAAHAHIAVHLVHFAKNGAEQRRFAGANLKRKNFSKNRKKKKFFFPNPADNRDQQASPDVQFNVVQCVRQANGGLREGVPMRATRRKRVMRDASLQLPVEGSELHINRTLDYSGGREKRVLIEC